MGHPKRISIGADEITKMVPWLCSCFRTILCFPCHCFWFNFLPMSSWKHDFLYSCCLACSVLYPNIILDEERTVKSLHESTITKMLFSFRCGLGLSSINMAFLSVMRNYKSLKGYFLFFSGWWVLHVIMAKGKELAQPFIKLGMTNFQKYTEAKYSFLE